jgi:hypothetical protein
MVTRNLSTKERNMEKKANKLGERKVRKLILSSETLRTLTAPELHQVAGATGGVCTGSICGLTADCCEYN